MRFLLDTNVVIAVLRRKPGVTARVFGNPRRDYGLSVIVAHELPFGAYRSKRPDKAFDAFQTLQRADRRAGACPRPDAGHP